MNQTERAETSNGNYKVEIMRSNEYNELDSDDERVREQIYEFFLFRMHFQPLAG